MYSPYSVPNSRDNRGRHYFSVSPSSKDPRSFYPLSHHQRQFDEWEKKHPFGPSPGAGGNLTDLQDADPRVHGGRPPHGLRCIIMCAINGSPEKRLTLKEIRIAMNIRYPEFFTESSEAWQTSLRYTLSHDTAFINRIRSQRTQEDMGSFWVIVDGVHPDITPNARGRPQTEPKAKRGRIPERRDTPLPDLPCSNAPAARGKRSKRKPWLGMLGGFVLEPGYASWISGYQEQLSIPYNPHAPQLFPPQPSYDCGIRQAAAMGYPVLPSFKVGFGLPRLRDTGLLRERGPDAEPFTLTDFESPASSFTHTEYTDTTSYTGYKTQ
ncbi:hypothetical protein M422DRAFT_41095 [Sphaerobolus stellatus SS14]|nr:hypothetical protein M422DRAFT_41095 [Sphaerobolus stellatus SS14]